MTVTKLYVASSWRNQFYTEALAQIRARGFDCYDFRNPGDGDAGFSWREIAPYWESWTTAQYRAALDHPASQRGFASDLRGMTGADACVLVLPCGRSAHLEAGWFMGRSLPVAVYVPEGVQVEPELMYLLSLGGASCICTTIGEVASYLQTFRPDPVREHASAASEPTCEGPSIAASRNADEAPVFVLSEGRGNGRAHGIGPDLGDRLDTIRKRLASGSPFTAHAGDLAWAVGEIERLTESCNAIPRILMEREAPKWDEARERLFTCLAALERAITQRDEYPAALWLCAYETAWVRTPGEYNLVQPWPMEEGPPRLLVMCSDTFAWACADCEPCEYPRATDVLRIMQTEGWPGVVRWVQAQRQERGEMAEPIEPVARAMAREDELRAEIERLTKENERLTRLAYPTLAVGDDPTPVLTYYRAEIARPDALLRATAECIECGHRSERECTCTATDDPEDVIACHVCGRVECECGVGADEENQA